MNEGLSILIPVYNFDVTVLVRDIISQAEQFDYPWQLIVFEDGSEDKNADQNRSVLKHEKCIHLIERKNSGRHQARITLANEASYNYLLYLDADSGIIRNDYISKYVDILPVEGIVYGGRRYPQTCGLLPDYHLHCEYGHQREALEVGNRKRRPYLSFQTNNFLVPKAHMLLTSSFEEISLYGHEDTLMGVFWKKYSISISHIDNPVLHNYLHTHKEFLDKQIESIKSLINISEKHGNLDVRLAVVGDRIKKWGLKSIVLSGLNLFEKRFRKNLKKNPEKLFALDALKLQFYLKNI